MVVRSVSESPWLDARAAARLERRIEEALRRARATGAAQLVSVTTELDRPVDPSAVAAASRRPGEPWFCLEQPDRDAIALVGLGCVRALEADGEDRFDRLAARWRQTAADALADEETGGTGAGLTALGGFAFAPGGANGPMWHGFAAASLLVPEVSLARRGTRTWLTVNLEIAPDDTAQDAAARVRVRLDGLRVTPPAAA